MWGFWELGLLVAVVMIFWSYPVRFLLTFPVAYILVILFHASILVLAAEPGFTHVWNFVFHTPELGVALALVIYAIPALLLTVGLINHPAGTGLASVALIVLCLGFGLTGHNVCEYNDCSVPKVIHS